MQSRTPPLQRPRSLTALSGGAVVAGTRTLKDWQLASDLSTRTARFDRWHDKRISVWDNQVYQGVSAAGPVMRSALSTKVSRKPESASWHEELVKSTFSSLPKTVKGEVGLDQLEASFAMMKMPLDNASFSRYACELLPLGTDCVGAQEFMAFHKVVWANQPPSVQRFAGDPSATAGNTAYTGSVANRRLLRSSSVPSGASLKELRENEGMLRSAFKRYERSPGYLERSQLPALFQDVGLDLGINSDLGLKGTNRLNLFLNSQFASTGIDGKDRVSFHDVVEMQNKYIATLEGEKDKRKSESIVYPTLNTDSFVKQSMRDGMVSRPSSAVKREAALQEKVAMVGEFSNRMAEARGGGRAASSKSRPCLYYFPMAARGELIRMIAALGGLPLDDSPVLEDAAKASFGSPGALPCLQHGDLRIAQSYAIEMYIASIAPGFAALTPSQRAIDSMFCKMKDDYLQEHANIILPIVQKAAVQPNPAEEIPKICAKWLPTFESKLPDDGFVLGLTYPTAADLALVVMAKGYMPFGALNKISGFNPLSKYPKFAAHVDRVAKYPAVREYLETSATMDGNPFGM